MSPRFGAFVEVMKNWRAARFGDCLIFFLGFFSQDVVSLAVPAPPRGSGTEASDQSYFITDKAEILNNLEHVNRLQRALGTLRPSSHLTQDSFIFASAPLTLRAPWYLLLQSQTSISISNL